MVKELKQENDTLKNRLENLQEKSVQKTYEINKLKHKTNNKSDHHPQQPKRWWLRATILAVVLPILRFVSVITLESPHHTHKTQPYLYFLKNKKYILLYTVCNNTHYITEYCSSCELIPLVILKNEASIQ